MRFLRASIEVLTPMTVDLYKQIEVAGRTCYKSEELATEGSAEAFVRRMIRSGHEAMIEHADVSIRFICDRGVTHEVVRHRIASYAQESTRYCNYSKDKFGAGITYIDILGGIKIEGKVTDPQQIQAIIDEWLAACEDAERHYLRMLELGASPQIARSALNNSTKTEIVVKMNCREWRHFITLRDDPTAHPMMREVANKVHGAFHTMLPALVFDMEYYPVWDSVST